MWENRFLLFLNYLRLAYSILKSFALPLAFHCFRHTFAVMMLDLEIDIYTVSKLLGHRDLSTTQIYAKILDKNKQAAISRIPDLLK